MRYEIVDGYVHIPLKTWKEMQHDLLFLQALEENGVDNWSGYDDAVDRCEELREEAGSN